MPFSIMKCGSCSKTWSSLVAQGLFTYCLPDGRYAWIYRDFRWCHGCKGFSVVEKFPNEDDLIKELAEEKSTLNRLRQVKENAESIELNEKSIREIETSIEWLKQRIAPPRCLICGSLDICEDDPDEHPECGGKLKEEYCEAFVSKRKVYRRYDIEGCFLRLDEDLPIKKSSKFSILKRIIAK